MKKLLYLIGFISSLILTVGVTFKLLQRPFSAELLTIGLLALLLIFLPFVIIEYRNAFSSKSSTEKLKTGLGIASISIVGFSSLFKLMHLQGAVLLLILGAFVFGFGFLPVYFFSLYKKSTS